MGLKHRILILTSDFPPLAGTNTQRIYNFVKRLPAYGWRPHIITIAIEDMPLIEKERLVSLPGEALITRVKNPDPFCWWRRRQGVIPFDVSTSGFSIKLSGKNGNKVDEKTGQCPGGLWRSLLSHGSNAVKGLFQYSLLYSPDSLRLWADAAARHAIKGIKKEVPDILLTSCPSFSSHIAGLKAKRATGVPWIADFRDLWYKRPGRVLPSRLHEWIDRKMEEAVVREADRIIIVSPRWEEIMRRRHGRVVNEKLVCITNGYNPDDVPKKRSESTPGQITFVYTGAMFNAWSPAPFLRAMGNIKKRRPELLKGVKIRLIGYAGDEMPMLQNVVHDMHLADNVDFMGTQSHDRCVAEQARADVLLLIMNGPIYEDIIPGKSFEYLSLGKPILALIPENGIAADMLRKARTGCIINCDNSHGIEKRLEQMLENKEMLNLAPEWDYIRQFDYNVLTNKLIDVMTELIKEKQGRDNS